MKWRISVPSALVLAFLACSAVQARSIPGARNEVDDPWFYDYGRGLPTWYVTPPAPVPDPRVVSNPGNLPGGYFDPGRNPGDYAFLRTIVDDYKGLWDPRLRQKEIDLSFFAHLDGGGYVKVRFDWWNDPSIPQPSNDPQGPGNPPDGQSDWYTLTKDNLGEFQVLPLLPGEDPDWFGGPFALHQIWDFQPRWVSIEIMPGIDQNSLGGEAMITGIDFEARCIPEPATLALVGFGGAALLLMRRRGRRA
jgi:hypothetical protein